MLDPRVFVEHIQKLGVALFTGVPDSLLKPLCSYFQDSLSNGTHITAANEGAAVGLAIGHYLSSGKPGLVYLQNSGIGHAINPLLSLADPDVYGIPMVLLVGWRGAPGVRDEPQHVKQGRVMVQLFEAMSLPWALLPRDDMGKAKQVIKEAIETSLDRKAPFLILVEKNTFEQISSSKSNRVPKNELLPSREEALNTVIESIGNETINISTTGMLSRELFEYRLKDKATTAQDFLTVGGMGHASSIALGVAIEKKDREVWCLDGDGALLMHAGTLAVVSKQAPTNYFHVIFNNGVHDSVGGQPTSIDAVDVPSLAKSCGYRFAARSSNLKDIPGCVQEMRAGGGPALLEIKIRPGNRPDIGRPTRTPKDSKTAFMAAIGTIEQ